MAARASRRENFGGSGKDSAEKQRDGLIQISNGPVEAHERSEYRQRRHRPLVEHVDYYARKHEKGQKSLGEDRFVISNVNEKDKESWRFGRCLGLTAVGRSKVSGKNISFLAHVSPPSVYKISKGDPFIYSREGFTKAITERLQEFVRETREGTVDMVVFGGADQDHAFGNYRDHIQALAELAEGVTGIQVRQADIPNRAAVELSGSEFDVEESDIYFDTLRRRLYIGRYSGIAKPNYPEDR